jgi:membrane glycosyltransferase
MTSDRLNSAHEPAAAEMARASLTTPAGLQANAMLTRRRLGLLAAVLLLWGAFLSGAGYVLGAGGWTLLDIVLFVLFAIATPWAVLGFCNAAAGLWLLHGARNPLAAVAPFLPAMESVAPLNVRTAVLMTLRNEDPARALARLQTVKASLDDTGEGAAFSYFLLSDTDRPEVAAAEEAGVDAWRDREREAHHIVYRRRADNAGYKAGNVRDFCEKHGHDFELMLPLDADSLMTGESIVALVRIMQAHPKIGILQSLVVGMPSSSPFARIFQFGMRFGMRSYTMGQAWWVGDCGPFWGHNAVLRIAPFLHECKLPVIPGGPPFGGHVLSHDQVEATLMRRAGYEVRVMPVEGGSYEENPPDVLEFIRRDVRWCQGNMQYVKLLDLPGLKTISRFQLIWAIMMFVGTPAFTAMIALSPAAAWQAVTLPDFPAGAAKALYVSFLLVYLAPKIAGLLDAMLTEGEVARFGGRALFYSSAAIELVFSFLQGAISTIRTSIFMIGLAFGKSIVWGGQRRDAEGLSWRDAAVALWPQLAFGVAVLGALALISPTVLIWSLPLTAGYVLAIPFAVLTASPRLGRFMKRHGIAGIPEDFNPPPEIAALQSGKAGAP